MKQAKENWQFTTETINRFEILLATKGRFQTDNPTPWIDLLCEFNIFFTKTPL